MGNAEYMGHPGNQMFEKQIGGMYLGEVARQVLIDLVEKMMLFSKVRDASAIQKPYIFETRWISEFEVDSTPQLDVVKKVLEEHYRMFGTSLTDRVIVKLVCAAVSTRAARLVSAGVGSVCRRIAP